MKLAETVFVNRRPVGRIVQDAQSGEVAFIPRDEHEPLPQRPWRTLDELKAVLQKLYWSAKP